MELRRDIAQTPTGSLATSAEELDAEFPARFEAVRGRLTAICTAIVGPDHAADLVQETYLRARERLHQLQDPDRFEAWLARVALNEARSALRSRRRVDERIRRLEPQQAAAGDPGLRQLIEQLPLRERAVLVLHYGYGYRMGEIARLLDLSTVNVRTLAHRGRRRLRERLEEADR